jgi:hypothetical protein
MAIPAPDLTVEQRAELFYEKVEQSHLFAYEGNSQNRPLTKEKIIQIARYIEAILPIFRQTEELFPDQTGLARALFCDAQNRRIYIELEHGNSQNGTYRDIPKAIRYDHRDPKVFNISNVC